MEAVSFRGRLSRLVASPWAALGAIEWRDLTGGQNGLIGIPSPEAFGRMFLEMEMTILASILTGLSLAAYWVLARGRWGLAMRAVSDSDVAAQSVGIDPLRVTTLAFILSAALAAMAGGLFTPLQGFISPGSFPFFQSILFLLAVVVGGSRTPLGPVLGVLVTVLLPELLSSRAEYRLLSFGGLMLGVLLAAPRGMMGLIQKVLLVEDPRRASPSDRGLAELVGREGPARPLEATGLTISFGGVQAARNVSFTAEPGRITSIIGPNGAGKTTVLNMIGGFYAPYAGSIRLEGDLAGKSAWTAARAGIARTYQTTLLFEQMSVLDNILTADAGRALGVPFGPPPSVAARERVEALLAFVSFTGPVEREAGALPHVDRPRVLLMDAPAAGLAPAMVRELFDALADLRDEGVTILLVDQMATLALAISDRAYVLEDGQIVKAGTARDLLKDADVEKAYLGAAE